MSGGAMQRTAEEAAHRRMAELRRACEDEVRAKREAAAIAADSFRQSLRSIRSMAEETLANREKLGQLKEHLKELEAELTEARAEKTCKEAKHVALVETLSSTTARTEALRRIIQDQKARKDEYAAIISQQLLVLETLEEKSNQDISDRESIQEAVSWYNKVLGFQAEGGEGVKFIFNKVVSKNPDNEYSFTIRLDGDVYTLLSCDPFLEGIKEQVADLNKTNGLFKFVKIMREKFVASALNEKFPITTSSNQDPSSFTVSSPPPVSQDSVNETMVRQRSVHFEAEEGLSNHPKKVISRQVGTPQSLLTRRQSPRLRTKRFP